MTAEERLEMIQKAVDTQAEDEALWFENISAPEAYLQQALRDLHKVIEHGDEEALERIIDCKECSSG